MGEKIFFRKGGVRGALPPEPDIETLVIFFAIDRVFQVVDININIKHDEGDQIR
jgi:hypothetical protein